MITADDVAAFQERFCTGEDSWDVLVISKGAV
jgi:hypothetical protein